MRKRLGWRFNQRHSIPDWIEHRYDGLRYARRVLVTRPQNLIGYWPMWEGNGVVSFDNSPQGNHDGAYTGVTLAQPGIGDGRYSAFFDGVNDFNNIYSVALNAAFNGSEGSILVWARVFNAGVWTDATVRRLVQIQVNATNYLFIERNAANNTIQFQYSAGGTTETQLTAGLSNIDFASYAMTWSKSGDIVHYYIAGVASGAPDVGLGIWAGNLSAINTVIGAFSTGGVAVWHGQEAHCALWDAALTPAEMAFLGTPIE